MPACGSARVYPSRLRNAERLRQSLTTRQPHRCHEHGWRKWRDLMHHPEGPDVRPDDLRTGRTPRPLTPADLEELDPAAPSR